MVVLRFLWAFLTSRWLWTPDRPRAPRADRLDVRPARRASATAAPLRRRDSRGSRIIAGLVLLWLLWLILAQRRAIRANRLFVAELAAPEVEAARPRRRGRRRRRRQVPGGHGRAQAPQARRPPLPARDALVRHHRPAGLRQDHGAAPVRARLPLRPHRRPAGRRRHPQLRLVLHRGRGAHRHRRPLRAAGEPARGRRRRMARLPRPPEEAPRPPGAERRHRRASRSTSSPRATPRSAPTAARSASAWPSSTPRLEIRLPVYLLVTKADLDQGLRAELRAASPTAEREQVWGATFAPGERADGAAVGRELAALVRAARGPRRPAHGGRGRRSPPAPRSSASRPRSRASRRRSRLLVDTVFGESRYEESAWLRGFYLTSATQEGTPIDRLVGSARLVLRPAGRAAPTPRRASSGAASSCAGLLTDVVFGEAGLATLDPKAEQRRALALARRARSARPRVAGARRRSPSPSPTSPTAARSRPRRTSSTGCASRSPPAAARQAPVEPSDLERGARRGRPRSTTPASPLPGAFARLVGPSAAPRDRGGAGRPPTTGALRNILEPRMVALLEATMWRQIRDPDFLLGALKTYRMMTGLSQMDPDFAAGLVGRRGCPSSPTTPPFPTEAALDHQLAAIDAHGRTTTSYIAARRGAGRRGAGERLLDPARPARLRRAAAPTPPSPSSPEWIPAELRRPERRQGLRPPLRARRCASASPGIFTYAGFHDAVLARLEDVAAPGGARPLGLRRRLRGERRRLGLGARRGHAEALLRGLHRPVGRLPARHRRWRR